MARSFILDLIRVVLLVPLLASVNLSQAFTAPSASTLPVVASSPSSHPAATSSIQSRLSIRLQEKRKDTTNAERGSDEVNALMGLDRGKYLLALVFAVCVWFFTVPVEFRRTKICTEVQTRDFPDVCMTSAQFTSGIADYYKNGGGIKFDFSVEGRD